MDFSDSRKQNFALICKCIFFQLIVTLCEDMRTHFDMEHQPQLYLQNLKNWKRSKEMEVTCLNSTKAFCLYFLCLLPLLSEHCSYRIQSQCSPERVKKWMLNGISAWCDTALNFLHVFIISKGNKTFLFNFVKK
jgi:hypothetical protein